jgi:glycosyltransferase involved in cell wall biosynthesis
MKVGLLITTYNRPNYLKECLESVKAASKPDLILLVDDHSTDAETRDVFLKFHIPDVPIIKHVNKVNSGIKESLRWGFDRAFNERCECVINLDGDAIVKANYLERIISLKNIYKHNIVTGFNCKTKNKDGSERHKILVEEEDFNTKKSVGGINMCINLEDYHYLLPQLNKAGNWDHNFCLAHPNDMVCTVPSVVQHIGVNSSMGHNEPPDVADDFYNLLLPNVTLIGVDCIDINRLIRAATISTKDIQFGDVKLLSSFQHDKGTMIKRLQTKQEYSEFVMKELYKYVKTDYALIFQYDGYVLNWQAWDNEFLNYDYVGATWWYKDGMNVGNGGFSLRSRKLLQILANDTKITNYHPEDDIICRVHRPYLENEYGIKFAPEEIANKFSIEAYNSPDTLYKGQFGYHGHYVRFK